VNAALSKLLRGMMAAITAAAAAACFYLTFIEFDYRRPIAAYVSLALLLLPVIVAALQRRPKATGVHVGLFAVCFFLLWAISAKGIGHKDVGLRLSVTGSGPASGTPHVYWSSLSSGSWFDSPWERVRTARGVTEYRSTGGLVLYTNLGYFENRWTWHFEDYPLVVIVAQGKRFRFDPGALFGRGQGLPDMLAATIDIDSYVSGAKQPTPVDWPPDNAASTADKSAD
jgi:hypothetical protein